MEEVLGQSGVDNATELQSISVRAGKLLEVVAGIQDIFLSFLNEIETLLQSSGSLMQSLQNGDEFSSEQRELVNSFRKAQINAFKRYHAQAGSLGDKEYADILAQTPWRNEAHLSHNVGITAFQMFGSMTSQFFRRNGSDDQQHAFRDMLQGISFLIKQTQAHFASFSAMVRDVSGLTEPGLNEVGSPVASIAEATRIAVMARLCFSPLSSLHVPGVSSSENGIKVRFLADEDLKMPVKLEYLIELLFVPISNAHRIMNQMMQKDCDKELVIEITARGVDFKGKKFAIIECFSEGTHLDLEALINKLVQLPEESILSDAGPELCTTIGAMKRGSRQACLSLDSDNFLGLEGLTLTAGGTGLGLHNTRRQVRLMGGQMILNNVYEVGSQKPGFNTTYILPADLATPDGFDPNTLMRASLELSWALKDALKKGELLITPFTQEAERSLA